MPMMYEIQMQRLGSTNIIYEYQLKLGQFLKICRDQYSLKLGLVTVLHSITVLVKPVHCERILKMEYLLLQGGISYLPHIEWYTWWSEKSGSSIDSATAHCLWKMDFETSLTEMNWFHHFHVQTTINGLESNQSVFLANSLIFPSLNSTQIHAGWQEICLHLVLSPKRRSIIGGAQPAQCGLE